MKWDVFISYASEDLEAVAEPLAVALVKEGLRVWFDKFIVKVGDSLRQEIDEGLASSSYGIVILSPSFFEKHFPNMELNGLSQREVDGKKVILPIWYNVNENDVRNYSPVLAGRKALIWEDGLESVTKTLKDLILGELETDEKMARQIDLHIPMDITPPHKLPGIARHSGKSLIGKKLEVYQEAYSRWARLFGSIHSDDSEKHKLIQQTREWFNNNNIYLDKLIRTEVDNFIRDVAIYRLELDNYHREGRRTNQWDTDDMKNQRQKLREKFQSMSSLGRKIQDSL